jgi:DNA-binding MarR family transcriptional regulator
MTRTTLAQDTFLDLLRAHERLTGQVAVLLRDSGLSSQQYNVLRILRGAGPDGLPCQEIGARMVNRVPDVTRLLDRLVAAELVSRRRSNVDRRVVLNRITGRGLVLLADLDAPVRDLHRRQFAALDPDDLRRLGAILGRLAGAES